MNADRLLSLALTVVLIVFVVWALLRLTGEV